MERTPSHRPNVHDGRTAARQPSESPLDTLQYVHKIQCDAQEDGSHGPEERILSSQTLRLDSICSLCHQVTAAFAKAAVNAPHSKRFATVAAQGVPALKALAVIFIGLLLLAPSDLRAAEFDDIVASAQSLHSGDTYHGYCEFRVSLENRSIKNPHQITLVYPNHSWSYGNGISRLSRTVTLGPGASAVVPFWQPPLPVFGDNSVGLTVDGDEVGSVVLPNAGRHLNRMSGRYASSPLVTTVFVSRSLDHDELSRALGGNEDAFTASQALGAPDSGGRHGFVRTAWVPSTSTTGPQWLELDYSPPLIVTHVRIYGSTGPSSAGEIMLTGTSGTNLLKRAFSSGSFGSSSTRGRSRGSGSFIEFSFPETSEPVKSVRLNFPSAPGGTVSIDAVELSSLTTSAWASSARASSDASAMAPSFAPPGSRGSESCECLRSELPVSEWSEHWLAYTPYDAIALNGSDLSSMPPAVANAVWRYVEAGGNLFLIGGGKVPEPWHSLARYQSEGKNEINVGFGKCFEFPDEMPSKISAEAAKVMLDAAKAEARYWHSLPDSSAAANRVFPVVQNLKVPVRGIVFIMLAFVLLIGPANLIVLSRLKRRTWMLWTIPAISFFTCVLVFAYSLLSEGIRPDIRMTSVTLLDQVNHRATSVGAAAFYCPLTPNQGLRFSFDTEATPMVETYNYRSGAPHEVDWTQIQQFRRGFVTARVPAQFALRKSETQRERLQIEGSGTHWTVVNGLGANIRSLWLADASGRVYTAANVTAGQHATLVPSADYPKVTAELGPGLLFLKTTYAQEVGPLSSNPVNHLLPGTYVAELEANPFLENALGANVKARHKQITTYVFGILDSPSAFAVKP